MTTYSLTFSVATRTPGNDIPFDITAITNPDNTTWTMYLQDSVTLTEYDGNALNTLNVSLTTTISPYIVNIANFNSALTFNDYNLLIKADNDPSQVFTMGGGPVYLSCFPTGTQILTPDGYKAVETIQQGDLLTTAKGTNVPVNVFSFTINKTDTTTAPYRLPAGTLGEDYQFEDICLSEWHAIQDSQGIWQIPRYLAKRDSRVQQYDIGKSVTYYHFECPNYFDHDLVIHGCVCESFKHRQNPGSLTYISNEQKTGFLRIRPENASSIPEKSKLIKIYSSK